MIKLLTCLWQSVNVDDDVAPNRVCGLIIAFRLCIAWWLCRPIRDPQTLSQEGQGKAAVVVAATCRCCGTLVSLCTPLYSPRCERLLKTSDSLVTGRAPDGSVSSQGL